MVTELEIFSSSSLLAPESLNSRSGLGPVGEVSPPHALDSSSHVMPIPVSHVLQSKQCLGSLDERLRHTHLPFFLGNACILQDLFHGSLCGSFPSKFTSIGGSRRKKEESVNKFVKVLTVCETCSSNADVFLKTKILDLVENIGTIVFCW